MRLLLDTHIFLAVIDVIDDKVSVPTALRFAQATDEFYVSVASLWEIGIKYRLGKLPLTVALDRLPSLASATDIDIIAINADHALASVVPGPSTRGPFDRLVLAQCQIEGFRLVTVDRALVDHPLAFK